MDFGTSFPLFPRTKKLTLLFSAFAVPNATFHLNFDQDNSGDLLHRLTKLAHTANKRVKLSVGGWGGSKYFSKAVSTEANRQLFASRIVAIYDEFGIDGIDMCVFFLSCVDPS